MGYSVVVQEEHQTVRENRGGVVQTHILMSQDFAAASLKAVDLFGFKAQTLGTRSRH